ncbi:MAG: RNA polymerase sigma factor [Actinobacteria bacterium]|nr:RNA polymerase sigma factor [Actinomycetota bacterium]
MSNLPTNDARRLRMEALFAQHHRSVLGFALRRVSEPADAADVVADVFLIAWRRLSDVPDGDATRAWLFGTARRVLANQRRGDHRRNGLAERMRLELEAHLPFHEPDTECTAIHQALAELTERDREILQLSVWEELSPAEIAVAMNMRGTTVRSRLRRARKRFEAHLVAGGWNQPLSPSRSAALSTANSPSETAGETT